MPRLFAWLLSRELVEFRVRSRLRGKEFANLPQALAFLDNFRLANQQESLCVPKHLRLRKASHRNHCDVVRLFRVRELPGRFNKFLYQ